MSDFLPKYSSSARCGCQNTPPVHGFLSLMAENAFSARCSWGEKFTATHLPAVLQTHLRERGRTAPKNRALDLISATQAPKSRTGGVFWQRHTTCLGNFYRPGISAAQGGRRPRASSKPPPTPSAKCWLRRRQNLWMRAIRTLIQHDNALQLPSLLV